MLPKPDEPVQSLIFLFVRKSNASDRRTHSFWYPWIVGWYSLVMLAVVSFTTVPCTLVMEAFWSSLAFLLTFFWVFHSLTQKFCYFLRRDFQRILLHCLVWRRLTCFPMTIWKYVKYPARILSARTSFRIYYVLFRLDLPYSAEWDEPHYRLRSTVLFSVCCCSSLSRATCKKLRMRVSHLAKSDCPVAQFHKLVMKKMSVYRAIGRMQS